jgi:hypothetical protein
MSKDKRKEQLGVAIGTAQHRLRKMLLWGYVVKCGDNTCYQCGKEIISIDDLSIEHKTPWLDSEDPKKLFFDPDNITYSHLSCNVRAARKPNKKYETPEERRAVQWKRYWDKMGKEQQQERRRANYKKYGC